MNDPTELTSKVAANILTEIFKSTLSGLKDTERWLQKKSKSYDFLNLSAQKYAEKIEKQYNIMRIFGMKEPMPLRNIFVKVNILEKRSSQQRLTASDLDKIFNRNQRGFRPIQKTITGIDVVDKLEKILVFGKPGSGKTTFLKYLALQTLDGTFQHKRIPIFIGLKDWSDSITNWSDPSVMEKFKDNKSDTTRSNFAHILLDFIVQQFDICDFPDAKPFVERMLKKGDCLILLDGLDEVTEKNVGNVNRSIRDFTKKYDKNKVIISCRPSATFFTFTEFTEVEIADFDDIQIQMFINNWFKVGSKKAKLCWEKMNAKGNERIVELASVPLLLTMFCLTFDEIMDFPPNRAELYKEAIDALLKKWDSSRDIQRDTSRSDIYKQLSLKRKESLLSRIAATTFDKDQYFCKKSVLAKYISDYIANLPITNPETLDSDSEAIIESIEAHHGLLVEQAVGIYSFSHLTFQEYFTARYIVENESKGTFTQLFDHFLYESKWREVILLSAGMLGEADSFLLTLRRRISRLVRNEELAFTLKRTYMAIKRGSNCTITAAVAFAIYYLSKVLIVRFRHSETSHYLMHIDDLEKIRDMALNIAYNQDRITFNKLAKLYKTIPHKNRIDQVIATVVDLDVIHLLIQDLYSKTLYHPGHIYKWITFLRYYLLGNQIMIDCLNTDCFISKETRQLVEGRMLVDIVNNPHSKSTKSA